MEGKAERAINLKFCFRDRFTVNSPEYFSHLRGPVAPPATPRLEYFATGR